MQRDYNFVSNPQAWGVEIFIPEANKSDIKVAVENRVINIEYVDERRGENSCSFRTLSYNFKVPNDVSIKNFKAQYKDDVLTIGSTKIEPSKKGPMTVEVK